MSREGDEARSLLRNQGTLVLESSILDLSLVLGELSGSPIFCSNGGNHGNSVRNSKWHLQKNSWSLTPEAQLLDLSWAKMESAASWF